MALYLFVIAVISLGISGLTIYLGSVATSVEKAVEEKITKVAGIGDDSQLLKELLRANIEKPPSLHRKHWISISRGSNFAQFAN